MRLRFWLRGPSDDPQVELISDYAWYWRTADFGQRGERSVMAELTTSEEVARLEIHPGHWYMPGSLP